MGVRQHRSGGDVPRLLVTYFDQSNYNVAEINDDALFNLYDNVPPRPCVCFLQLQRPLRLNPPVAIYVSEVYSNDDPFTNEVVFTLDTGLAVCFQFFFDGGKFFLMSYNLRPRA